MEYRRLGFLIAICLATMTACLPGLESGKRHRPGGAAAAASPSPSASAKPSPTRSTGPKRGTPPLVTRTGPKGSALTTGYDGVALTFDDGPSPKWTPKVLALLRSAKVKATFCVVGIEVRRHPKLVRAIVRDGHTLCNHSWGHDQRLGSRSAHHIEADIARTDAAIRKAVPGARINYYRQPGGKWTKRVIAVAQRTGHVPLHWSVDPQDWRKPPAGKIARFLLRHTKKGDVLLLHDGGGDRATTLAALRRVLPKLNRRFTLVPL